MQILYFADYMIKNYSNLDVVLGMKRILETHDSYIIFDDNTIFFESKKGIEINFSREIDLLIKAVVDFGNEPFIYISNQCQHASVLLYDYAYLEMLPNLIGMAIVIHNESNSMEINLDQSRFKNPLKIFDSLVQAKKWSKRLLSEKEN
jgi:hypothetical protein